MIYLLIFGLGGAPIVAEIDGNPSKCLKTRDALIENIAPADSISSKLTATCFTAAGIISAAEITNITNSPMFTAAGTQ